MNILLTILLICCVGFTMQQSLTSEEVNDIRSGTINGDKLIKQLNAGKTMNDKFKDLANFGVSFLKGVHPMLDAVIGLAGNQKSAEYTQLETEFEKVKQRLNDTTLKVEDLKQVVQWEAMKLEFSNTVKNIQSYERDLEKILDGYKSYTHSNVKTKQAINTYLKNYPCGVSSANRLYQTVMIPSAIGTNLIPLVVKQYRYDTTSISNFMVTITQYLLQAIQQDMMYVTLKTNGATSASIVTKSNNDYWKKRLEKWQKKMIEIDAMVMQNWNQRLPGDIAYWDNLYKNTKNKEFATILYDTLKNKYFWREWMVVINGDTTPWRQHVRPGCNVIQFNDTNGRNIVVAHKDLNDNDLGIELAKRIIKESQQNKYIHAWIDSPKVFYEFAKPLLGSCDKPYTLFASFLPEGIDWHYKVDTKKYYIDFFKFIESSLLPLSGEFMPVIFF